MTGSIWHVAAALVAFLATHSLPALKPVRARCVSALGERGYLFAYSLLSIAVITWVVRALIDAPYIELWPMTVTSMWLTVVLMVPATIFLVFGFTTPNPFSIPIKPGAFDPDKPGILAISRHPLLLGLAFWALAHIPPNGSMATVMMFGFAAAFSLAGMKILDARRQKAWGLPDWQSRAAGTSLLRWTPSALSWTNWRWGLALVVYVGLIAAHPLVIGVSPLP